MMKRFILACVLAFGFAALPPRNRPTLDRRLRDRTTPPPMHQNNLIASSTTAGAVVVPSFTTPGGGAIITRLRLATNKATGWDAVTLRARLWLASPTYTNGDGAAYAIATGAAGLLGQFDISLRAVWRWCDRSWRAIGR